MRIGPHCHPCDHCRTPTDCDGTTQRNFDGWPEWICLDYHALGRAQFFCEDCQDKASAAHAADLAAHS